MSKETQRSYDLEIAAGHCSFSHEHEGEMYELAETMVSNGKGGMIQALTYGRVDGLKSKSFWNGEFMGVDREIIEEAIVTNRLESEPPSVTFAARYVKQTGIGVATEIMIPHLQIPAYQDKVPGDKVFGWNPSVQQLGWQIQSLAGEMKKLGGRLGLKNGKWEDIERTWVGLESYVQRFGCHVTFIDRGIDSRDKGDYRNLPVPDVMERLAITFPHWDRWFDPSHSYGPKLRNEIVQGTVDAMKRKVPGSNEYLYTGILIEVGTSETDTDQHITVAEFKDMAREIATFRKVRGPI